MQNKISTPVKIIAVILAIYFLVYTGLQYSQYNDSLVYSKNTAIHAMQLLIVYGGGFLLAISPMYIALLLMFLFPVNNDNKTTD